VRAAGVSWRAYDRFMQKNVKRAGDERLTKVPADLDTKPYRDEHDVELLERMAAAVERGHLPPGRSRAAVHGAIHKAKRGIAAHRHETPARGAGRGRKKV
jgi:hypothetical protein